MSCHYLPFTPPSLPSLPQDFVFQYEVKMEEPLQCGGAYVKLLGEGAVSAPDMLDNETPYVIMFGPDKCGGTNKVRTPSFPPSLPSSFGPFLSS